MTPAYQAKLFASQALAEEISKIIGGFRYVIIPLMNNVKGIIECYIMLGGSCRNEPSGPFVQISFYQFEWEEKLKKAGYTCKVKGIGRGLKGLVITKNERMN